MVKKVRRTTAARRKMNSDPKYSAGARYERKAFRSMLRRRLKNSPDGAVAVHLQALIDWVLTREKRYDPDKGGL